MTPAEDATWLPPSMGSAVSCYRADRPSRDGDEPEVGRVWKWLRQVVRRNGMRGRHAGWCGRHRGLGDAADAVSL